MNVPRWRGRALALTCVALLGPALAGCFNPFNPLVSSDRGVSTPAPVPSSPENILRLFEWCWNNRAIDEYREVFTDDYRFAFAQTDSAGNAYRDQPYRREDELASATNLFVGGGAQPPASSISLTFDRNLYVQPDSRAGRNPRWHKQITTRVTLSVRADEIAYDVQGSALFFVVRGDSATIPPALIDQGFRRDSTRWWIERWEDQTVQLGGGLSAGEMHAAAHAAARGLAAGRARRAQQIDVSPITVPASRIGASGRAAPAAVTITWVSTYWGALKDAYRRTP